MRALDWMTQQSWAILPESLLTLLQIARRENASVEAIAEKLGKPLENNHSTRQQNGIAVIPITGPILRYANLFTQISGATSIDILTKEFAAAVVDPKVQAIVLDIDSPGGTVTGINELANKIYTARRAKPIIAYVSGMGASAAYWLASSAEKIIVDATASLGSIGVISTYTDYTEQRKKSGILDVEIISSQSPRKHLNPTTDEGRSQIQVQVDAIAEVFVNTVAHNRGVSMTTVLTDFGQGSLFVGSEAVKAGLADRLGSLEETLADLSRQKRGPIMNETLQENVAVVTAPSAQDLRHEGATAERERIRTVEEQLIPGHEALIQRLKFDGKTTGAEAAIKVLAAEKELRAHTLKSLHADSPPPLPPLVAQETLPESQLPLEEKCQAQWQRSHQLRSEFSSFEAYLAYERARANGQVKILKNNSIGE